MAELRDKNGRVIMKGDLLQGFHFREACRRRKNYLYHVAVERDGRLWMVPTVRLEPSLPNDGGECLLTRSIAGSVEIIHGHSHGGQWWRDRPTAKQ